MLLNVPAAHDWGNTRLDRLSTGHDLGSHMHRPGNMVTLHCGWTVPHRVLTRLQLF